MGLGGRNPKKAKASEIKVIEEKTITHPSVAVAEPEKAVEEVIEKTQKTINKLVDQGQLDEKKLKSSKTSYQIFDLINKHRLYDI